MKGVSTKGYTLCDTCEQGWQGDVKLCNCDDAKAGASVSVASSRDDVPKSMGKTGRELVIPIVQYGVEVYYIRERTNKRTGETKVTSYYYDGHWHSVFELWFYVEWQKTGLAMPTPEHRFYDGRRWKFDFAWLDKMIAVELEGGVYSRGRHTRGKGYKDDIEKYNHATMMGWRVYRFADKKQAHIDFMIDRVSNNE